ncbi:MAG: ferrous iron transport protein A [Chlorobium phaeobacteroides]|jgi:Fe2+ transport system protein FeoA|nr:ferrous iron transport protein A [Chlorobium phaeobacteroides]
MMVPLGFLLQGESAEIVGFRSGREKEHRGFRHGSGAGRGRAHRCAEITKEQRLVEMGFCPGEVIEVLQSKAGGLLLLKLRDSRLALDKQIAMDIIVRRVTA